MGAKTSIFEICKTPQIKKETVEIVGNKPLDTLNLGAVEDKSLSTTGYQYFSQAELKSLSQKYTNLKLVDISPPSKFQTSEVIGQGSFGRVLFAANLETGELMAIKEIPLIEFSFNSGNERIQELETEVEILSKLNHKNIVRYLGTKKVDQNLLIFMEFVAGGNISTLIHKYGKFNEILIRLYASQILEGLEYLHFNRIIHRDIKGANVLVGNDGICKLADFGSAKNLIHIEDRSQVKSLKGTTYWMAPEVMQQQGYGRFADIWSFGCLLVEMATGKPPWYYKTNQIAVFMHVCNTLQPPELPSEFSEMAKDFILSCFKRKPSERPNATKLLRHPFLTTVSTTPLNFGTGKTEDTYVSGSKFSTFEYKKNARVSAINSTSLIGSTIDADTNRRLHRYSIDNFEELNPEHAVKGPFNDIITTAKVMASNPEESAEEIMLNRPSSDESVGTNSVVD